MANPAVAPTQTPTAAKQPAVAPPSLTLQIPITPASSSGSNSGRQMSFSASAQSLPKGEVLRSTAQPINRHTYQRTLPTKPHHSRFAGRGNQFKGHTTTVTHSNSRTWIRGAITEKENWLRLEKTMKRMRFLPSPNYEKYSPFVPQTFEGYLGHRASVEAENAKRAAFLVEQMRLNKERKSRGEPKFESIFESRKFADGLSPVLCVSTIWSNSCGPTAARPQAPWPGDDEMDEEGNQRHGSNKDRFLPLPRVPANDTVVWKQRAMLMPSDFDEVRRLSDAIRRARKGYKIQNIHRATARRIAEGTEIAWAEQEPNRFWEEKMEEALNTGLSVELAEEKASTEAMETARETAVSKWVRGKEIKIRAKMRKFFPEDFINSLNYSDGKELEEQEKYKNEVNMEHESDDEDSEDEEDSEVER